LGFLRIQRNLDLSRYSDTTTETCLQKFIIPTPLEEIETKGESRYFKCVKKNAIVKVNSHTFTIITAKHVNKFRHKTVTQQFD